MAMTKTKYFMEAKMKLLSLTILLCHYIYRPKRNVMNIELVIGTHKNEHAQSNIRVLCIIVGEESLSNRQIFDISKSNFGSPDLSNDVNNEFVDGTILFEIDPGNKESKLLNVSLTIVVVAQSFSR